MKSVEKEIFNIKNDKEFDAVCIKIFKFQYVSIQIYKQYIDELHIDISKIKSYHDIPFLPIDFFKTNKIISEDLKTDLLFRSSGTTNQIKSAHYIYDKHLYERSFLKTFQAFYGKPENFTFLALLPSYLERNDSSLVYMVNSLSEISNSEDNGFYLNNFEDLYKKLIETERKKQKTILFGVSFALIDFFETYSLDLKNTIIIETGGMKGRKNEMTREEVHQIVKNASGIDKIHSEYGMTELLSQAYSSGENLFRSPKWMKVLIRDPNDPFSYLHEGKTGGINIIDLSNIYSCSFIETKDLGMSVDEHTFNVLGRFDQSDIRGCNLMAI